MLYSDTDIESEFLDDYIIKEVEYKDGEITLDILNEAVDLFRSALDEAVRLRDILKELK